MRVPKQSKPARGSEIDALVAGAGIAGLLTSALLLKQGRKVHLTEKTAQVGGRLSPELRKGFTLGAGFAYGDSAWWRAAADRLNISSPTLPVNQGQALLYGPKGWHAAEDIGSWESLLSENCTEYPVGGAYGVIQTLLDYCAASPNFSLSLESPLTSAWGEAGLIQKVSLGPEHELQPKDIYWCGDYKSLLDLLQGPGIPEPGPERVSWLKRFVKTNPQPGVVLEFAHRSQLGEFTETLLLPFSSSEKDDRRCLVGAFVSNRDPNLAPAGHALSSWVLPLSESEWGDNHETMKKIRSGRRLLEKAFPNFEASILLERVLVLDATVSPLGKRKGEWLQPVPNLFLAADWAMPQGASIASVADTLLSLE